MMITVKTDVSKARVSELLSHWSSNMCRSYLRVSEIVAPPKGHVVEDDELEFSEYPLNGGHVIFEEEDGAHHMLDQAAIEKGLNLMPATTPKAWCDFLREREDAETADQFVQLALFGKIVYG